LLLAFILVTCANISTDLGLLVLTKADFGRKDVLVTVSMKRMGVGTEASHLDKRQWALQPTQTGLDETIEVSMVATWSQCHKILPMLDVFLLRLDQRMRAMKIVHHAADLR
jgi:hypothetical protein